MLMPASQTEQQPRSFDATIADLERRIEQQDAQIIVDLLKGQDTKQAEDRVENDRIALASMKASWRAIQSKM